MKFRPILAAVLAVAAAGGAAAQAPADDARTAVASTSLTSLGAAAPAAGSTVAAPSSEALRMYSSLPLQGDSRQAMLDIVRSERLALEEAGGAAGGHPIKLVSLDDSTRAARKWTVGRAIANALRASRDDRTIAYLGDYNSGASAVSIPILNLSGILQVSPSNTYVGLTRREGADIGEPDKYYFGERTYGRVAPADHLQAAAIVTLLASLRVPRVLLLDDDELYGTSIARMVRRRALARGIGVRGPFQVRSGHWLANIKRLARRTHAGAMVFAGVTDNHAASVFKAAHHAAPAMTLIGVDGVLEGRFTRRLGSGVARRTFITAPGLPEAGYAPAGRAFYATFRTRYSHTPEPFAIFGYEAMKVVLAAVEAGHGERSATIDAFFATHDRDSVLGRYSIDRNGDTTLSTYGLYRVEDGQPTFDRLLDSST